MTALVTLAEAKAHLRIDGEDSDPEITLKMTAACELVVAFCDVITTPWTSDSAPFRVKAAVLLVLGNLMGSDRGDGVFTSAMALATAPDPVSERVRDLLWDLRTPVMA